MKALKEKRPSLRSILRGGLVILSLLALAFAVVACNTSGDDPDETEPSVTTTGPGQTEPEVTEPPRQVLTIRTVGTVTSDSYQGGEPKIDGLEIEVVWSDSPAIETLTNAELKANGFYVDPGYCDIPGLGAEAGIFYIMHRGSTAKSSPFNLPGVIALQSISIGTNAAKVYSDTRPNFGGQLELVGRYMYDTSTPTTICVTTPPTSVPADTGKEVTGPIVVNSFYPKFDMTGIQASKSVTFSVGDNINPSTPVNRKTVLVPVTYYQVAGVKFDHWEKESTMRVYDIDTGLARAAEGNTPAKSAAALAALVGSGNGDARFRVEYTDQNHNPGEAKVISYAQFKANIDYAREVHGITVLGNLEDIFYATNSVRTEKATTRLLHEETEILAWDDTQSDTGNPEWTFFMEYIPKQYIAGDDSAYVAQFPVNVPVWTFDGDIVVERKPAYQTDIKMNWPSSDVVPMGQMLLNAITDRWTLSPVYRLGSATDTSKALAFTSAMFQNGTTLRGTANGVAYGSSSGGIALRAGTLSQQVQAKLNATPAEASFVIWEYNYVLPLIYRGADDQETVTINVEYDEDRDNH